MCIANGRGGSCKPGRLAGCGQNIGSAAVAAAPRGGQPERLSGPTLDAIVQIQDSYCPGTAHGHLDVTGRYEEAKGGISERAWRSDLAER